MEVPQILNLEHSLTVPDGFELTLVMHEYGLYVSQSTLITNWYDFRLLALVIVFSQQGETRRFMYSLPKQSDLFDLQISFQLCVHQTCCGGFQPSRVQISYSFVDDDDARETIYNFLDRAVEAGEIPGGYKEGGDMKEYQLSTLSITYNALVRGVL